MLKLYKCALFEFMVLQVNSDAGKILFTNTYYPGCNDQLKLTQNIFLSHFADLFESLISNDGKHVPLGDFNVHMEEDERPEGKKFQCILREHDLSPTSNFSRIEKDPIINTSRTLGVFVGLGSIFRIHIRTSNFLVDLIGTKEDNY